MNDLVSRTREAILKIYDTKGIKAADTKVSDLLIQCETWKGNTEERGKIKGELSEIYLEYHLLWWMQHVHYMTLAKGICVRSLTSKATAEIDILVATPCKVYLFECKSFKGKKTLTDKCFLQGESSSKDVYDQSKYHVEILDPLICDCRFVKRSSATPYKILLFELSTDDIVDNREAVWKQNVPLLTPKNFDQWFATEFSKEQKTLWNYDSLKKRLADLEKQSADNFRFHMSKIMTRKGDINT